MERSHDVALKNYHSSKSVEYPLSNDLVQISLAFPGLAEISWSRVKGQCMKIDHCQIVYTPQVPANAEGTVIVVIHDNRMERDKRLQAEYTFPIRCPVTLNYFSTSFFSLRDEVPWAVYYKVIDSTMLTGTHFCQFKARIKLSSAKHSQYIMFRAPTMEINSKEFSKDQVDFMHVAIPKPNRVLCRSSSVIQSKPRFELGPGENWATKSMLAGEEGDNISESGIGPYQSLNRLGLDAIDPGPSASQLGRNEVHSDLGRIQLNANDLAGIVSEALIRGSQLGIDKSEENDSQKDNSGIKKKNVM
nr:V4 [Kozo leaf curling associated virus 2]UZC49229.1 V4 [Kozo leaf curling associated virus 2]UZC49241.1 V4 [Paper mulberry leaf curling associated virus 2]UZC49253.1 V4 [Paper mulberry leaf curling associated virus 2]